MRTPPPVTWSAAHAVLRSLEERGHLTAPTALVLEERLTRSAQPPRFFSATEAVRLLAVAKRLVPHDPAMSDLIGPIDERLAAGRCDGWRHAGSPPDPVAYRALLSALPVDFEELEDHAQDAHLQELQRTHPYAFADLLDELASNFYAHPLAQLSVGILSFADAPRWEQLELGELDPREADAYARLGIPAPGSDGA